MENRFRIKNKRIENKKNFKSILIVCGAEETEPNYFEAFRLNLKLKGVIVQRKAESPLLLVEHTIKLKKDAKKNKETYAQIWCVFDKDEFIDFDNAISKAKANKIEVAYSNECFELWYYLHFEYLQSALHRYEYKEKLTNKLEQKYEKNSKKMYDILKDKQETAIKNAKDLEQFHNGKNPSEKNPSTTVYKLVEVLNNLSL